MSENRFSYQVAYTGTGAARSFSSGFEPTRVEIMNVTDGEHCVWLEGLGNASFQFTYDGTITSTQGITVTAGSRVIALGTDAKINESGKAYILWASR